MICRTEHMKRSLRQIPGQVSIQDYEQSRKQMSVYGCSKCVCENCLYHNSGRYPYATCYDDHRAKANPYNAAHPDEPPRMLWSNWNKPGEQEHWCRGGMCYSEYYCEHFVKFKGCEVRDCLKAVVAIFQDGYISCSIIDSVGCEKCYKEFCEK